MLSDLTTPNSIVKNSDENEHGIEAKVAVNVFELVNQISDALNDADGHELNMSNYRHDDVRGLNDAYVSLFQTLEDINGKLIGGVPLKANEGDEQ